MKHIFITLKKKKITAFLVCFLLLFSHIFLYIKIDCYRNVIDSVSKGIFNSFNFGDKDALDNDNNIFFVFNLNEYINLGTKKPILKLPSEEEFVIENGVFIFDIKNNNVIKSAGNGIVKEIGYLENGLKYIEIRHSGNIVTRYENLKVVGVGQNFNVKNIHIIGTCSDEDAFVFKIYKNDKLIENINIDNGFILWQN